jgi:aerobic-type carbon monoxide dehydrogenase small subunit (CoxS/CutS family)
MPDEAQDITHHEIALHDIALKVNGTSYKGSIEARMLLSDFLRHELKLAGTHVGCEHGVCGACTVLLDGAPVRSCLMFAVQAQGRELATIEGLASASGDLSPLQAAMHEHHGLQCGYCTPGILMTMTAYLKEHPSPTEDEIREALSGNICRCTGYQNIVDAMMAAAEALRAAAP